MSLIEQAKAAQNNAYAPYSMFRVGAALRTPQGDVFSGCNVENVASPEGTCAEAGAIAAMVAGGARQIAEIVVVSDSIEPVTPCGGCRQKIAEFAGPDALITMIGSEGAVLTRSVAEMLPGAFGQAHLRDAKG